MSKPLLSWYSILVSQVIFFSSFIADTTPSNTVQDIESEWATPPYVYMEKADSLIKIGDFDRPEEYLQKAQAIYRKRQQWSIYIECFHELAYLYQKKADREKRKETLESAISEGQIYLYENHPVMGMVYFHQCSFLMSIGQFEEAAYYMNKGCSIFACEQDWDNYTWGKILISEIAYYSDLSESMECSLQDALAIVDGLEDKEVKTKIKIKILNLLEVLYDWRGDYDGALEVSQKILKALKGSTYQKFLGRTYNNIGAILYSKGDYSQSINYYEQALSIFKMINGENSISFADIYANIGLSYLYQKDFDKALEYFNKSLLITENSQGFNEERNTVVCYQNLSQVYFDLGNYDTCFYFAQKALKSGQEQQLYLDRTFNILASYQKERKDFEKALLFHRKTLAIRKKTLGERNPSVAISYRKMAEVYSDMNQIDTALVFCQKALLAISLRFDNKDIHTNPEIEDVNDMLNFGRLLELKGELLAVLYRKENHQIELLKSALATFEMGVSVIDEMRHGFQAENSKHILAANALSMYEKSIEVAVELSNWYRNQPNNSPDTVNYYLKKAFQFAEKNKATILTEAIKKSEALVFADIPATIFDRETQLKRDVAFYKHKLFEEQQKSEGGVDTLKMSFWKSKIFDLSQEYRNLVDTLERDYPDYYHLKNDSDAISVEALQVALQEKKQTLLEYFIGKKDVYIFMVTPEAIEVQRIANNEDLQYQFEALLQSLKVNTFKAENQDSTYLTYLQSAHWIYKKIVQNVLPEKDGEDGIGQLLVVPDGIMGHIPFEALLREYPKSMEKIDFGLDHLDYLIEDYSIGYAYSANLFLEGLKTKENNKKENYVGFAPVFENGEGADTLRERGNCLITEFQSLDASESEVTQLADLMNGEAFLKEEATKQNFINKGANGHILHLATHACLNETDPMFSTIHFVNDYLSTYELFNLRLDVDLAILSACNTGAGILIPGEGIMSLSKGFLFAGCPSIITSLWNVNDRAAENLILNLHTNLLEGQSKNDALRNAKLQYLETEPNRSLAPYFWATFIHVGNPKPIELQSSSMFFRWILGLIVLSVAIYGVQRIRR